MLLPLDKAFSPLYLCKDKNKIYKPKSKTMTNKVQLVFLWVLFLFLSSQVLAQRSDGFTDFRNEYDNQMADLMWRQYQDVGGWFDDAYRDYPTVPRGMLEAVAFQYTRFSPNVLMDTVETDPSEIPRLYSVMGLTLHGKGVFRENARLLAEMTPYSLDAILWEPGVAVLAYACAFARLQERYGLYGDSVEQYSRILVDLCELPVPRDGEDDFAMNSFLYMIYYFLSQEEYARYGVPKRAVDFDRLFGREYVRLKGDKAEVQPIIRSGATNPDYPNAVFVPAASCNYTSGRGGTIVSAVTIHYTQGTYAGSIAWFQNCSAKASAHYVIRSVDGQVTQMVPEADKAWHVGVANSYTIGIEHEAYGDIYSFFTMNMYQSSANLVKNICSRQSNINPHRVFYRDTLDDGTVLNYGLHSLGGSTSCTQIRGHQHYPSQTHTDPGQYWNWNLYYKLINDNPVVTVVTDSTGTFTDSGGATGDYGNDERRLFRIHVAGSDSIALTFHSFALEPDYDFMWIYQGGSEFSPLIGRWNTQSPGHVVAAGDQMLIEFRSDCATTAAGWNATWQAISANPVLPPDDDDEEEINDWEPDPEEPLTDNAPPQTLINMDVSQWVTQDFTATFTDSDDNGLKWRFYHIMESDGTAWRARPDQGFLCDNFDNPLDGTIWVNNVSNPWVVQNGVLRQDKVTADYAGVAAHHNGASHSAYLYDFYLNFSDGEECSFFFNCNNAPSGASLLSGYEVCFDRENHTVSLYRLIFGAKQLLKTNTQVFFQTGTGYLCRVVFDSSTGEIVVLRHANRIVRAVDAVQATTSDSYIGFVTRHAAVSIDNLRVYGSRGSAVPLSVGSASHCNLQQQASNGLSRTKLKSIVLDRAYKMSPLVEKALKVDYTAPPMVSNLIVQVDTLVQIDGTIILQVSASWDPSADGHSGIRRYYFKNASLNNQQWSPSWPDNGTMLSCYHCGTLSQGNVSLFSVVAENNAGLRSPVQSHTLSFDHFQKPIKNLSRFDITMISGKRLNIHEINSVRDSPSRDRRYSLYDISGKKLMEGVFDTDVTVGVHDLANGVYLVRVSQNGTVLQTEKVVLFK